VAPRRGRFTHLGQGPDRVPLARRGNPRCRAGTADLLEQYLDRGARADGQGGLVHPFPGHRGASPGA
ncbi:MAG: hypothetical protein M3325_14275, partial [Actinomycetota bacterium]|nr:hypothetical protein [Actinomycetota bacterium]